MFKTLIVFKAQLEILVQRATKVIWLKQWFISNSNQIIFLNFYLLGTTGDTGATGPTGDKGYLIKTMIY